MGIFDTRPRLQDRDFRQISGDSMTLSGETNINGVIRLLPNAVTGYVIKATDSNGTFGWQPVSVSADTNTFVTGGTLNGTELDLSWNTGGSVPSIELSGLTFTGNTSGGCITDLYISNLYGCSPITIHNNIQNVTSSALTGTYINVLGYNNTVLDGVGSLVIAGNSVLGGSNNIIDSVLNSTIAGGIQNRIINVGSVYSGNFIGAGFNNNIYASYGYNTIAGGTNNTIPIGVESGFIGGGRGNYCHSPLGVIGGGYNNRIDNQVLQSSIVGGYLNSVGGDYSFIGGGQSNTITGTTPDFNIIGGGAGNEINTSSYSSIGGGAANYIKDGGYNTISGGKDNTFSGSSYSSIVGGGGNRILHNNSHIIGSNISSSASGTTFVERFNISTLGGGTPIASLGITIDGTVVTGTAGGATIDPYQDEGNVNSITWDVSGTSTNYEATLTGDTTLNMSNVRNGDYGTLIVTQDGTGSHTLSFGGGTNKVVNGGGASPTLTATAGATDILSFTYNGSTFYWTVGNDYT